MTSQQYLWVAAAVAVAAGVLIYLFLKYRPRRSASERKRVLRALRSFARLRGFRVLDDITVRSGGRTGWADHMLVGYFGVLLVYDLYLPGAYFGGAEDENWRVNDGEKWYAMKNPVPVAIQCEGRVRTLLKDAGYRADVGRVIVITGQKKKTLTGGLKCSEDVVNLRDLGRYLERERFDADRGLDVAALAALLEDARQKDE